MLRYTKVNSIKEQEELMEFWMHYLGINRIHIWPLYVDGFLYQWCYAMKAEDVTVKSSQYIGCIVIKVNMYGDTS